MCSTPKFLHIKSKNGSKFRIIVPCGKCYDCMNKKRSEFVLRCKSEMSDTINKGGSCFFVTLKYSDDNLIYYDPYRRFSQGRKELERISKLSKEEPFKYSKFIIWKPHFQKFIQNLQKKIKEFSPTLLFRFALSCEYGTFSNRPHGHLLLFCPLPLTKEQFTDIFVPLWKLGHVEVDYVNEKCINYVAKHYVKDDCGSDIQQRVSPRFLYYTRYKGSLGRSLLLDNHVKFNFFNNVPYLVTGKYKVPFPRFIRKKLKPDGFSDVELADLETKSISNFTLEYFNEYGSSVVDHPDFLTSDPVNSLEQVCSDNFKKHIYEEFNKKLKYKRQQFSKKMLKLRREGYFDTDNEKNV